MKTIGLTLIGLLGAACGSDGIDSDEAARRAYLGLDTSVESSLALGFAGFNAANSANIDPQMMPGLSAGMLTITGQVDQGSSANKGMRLHVGMVDFSDGEVVLDDLTTFEATYNTDVDVTQQPALDLSLRGIPTGTFTGTLAGVYHLSGGIDADADLSLTFSGTLQAAPGGATRVPGTTKVTGTATSGDGVFEVNVTL